MNGDWQGGAKNYPVQRLEADEAPFRPHWIHSYFRWVEGLPIPHWLFYLILFLLSALAQHIVAWNRGLLTTGSFNLYLAFASIWLVECLYFGYHFERVGRNMLEQIWPLMTQPKGETFNQLNFRFNWIPSRWGNLLLTVGLVVGALMGRAALQVMPAVNYAFPILYYIHWTIPLAMALILVYRIVRQMRMLQQMVQWISEVNLFHLGPLYAVSHFTGFVAVAVLIIVYLNNFLITPEIVNQPSIIVVMVVNGAVALGIFLLPLRHLARVVNDEKQYRLKLVSERLETTYQQLHEFIQAGNWSEMDQKKNAAEALLAERKTIRATSTFPWQPRVLTGLVSTVLLPVVISLVQQWVIGWFGL